MIPRTFPAPIVFAQPLTVRSLEGKGKTTIPAGTAGTLEGEYVGTRGEHRYIVAAHVDGERISAALESDHFGFYCREGSGRE
jgi:hypothetical protein